MTRMQTIALALGAALLFAQSTNVRAQSDYKIGYVNMAAILQNAPQIPDLNQVLRDEFASRDASVKELQDELVEKNEKLTRDADVMSQTEVASLNREIDEGRRTLERRANELQEDLQIRRDELLNQLQIEIVQLVQKYAEKEEFDLIVTDAVWVSPAVDITADVYEAIMDEVGPPEDDDDE